MKIENVKIGELVEDPANVRVHPDPNIDALRASLSRFGQQKPVVVLGDTNVVIAGNATLRAAKALGWDKLAIVRSPLGGSEAVAYAIADNKIAELALWDMENLVRQVGALADEGVDPLALGFTPTELEDLRKAGWDDPPPLALANQADAYDEAADTFSVRIVGVAMADKDDVLDRVNTALDGTKYRASAI